MQITKNNIDELIATIKISLVKEDYQENVEKTLKDYRKRVAMPGFRQGKVPMGLIKRQYEKMVTFEEINKLVGEKLFEYLDNEKIDYIGQPLPSEREKSQPDFEQPELLFAFDVALSPKFDVVVDNSLKFTKYNVTLSDDFLNQQIESYKSQAGKFESADVVGEKSKLEGSVFQVDAEGNKLENGLSNNTSMLVSSVKDEDTKKQFIGKKVGEQINFDLKKAFPNETDAKYMLANNAIDFNTINANFAFHIDKIEDFIPGELNQENFDKFFGADTVHNEEEMRAKIVENYKPTLERDSDYKLMIDVREVLTSNTKFDLPVDFMVKWMLTRKENEGKTKESFLQDYPTFENDLRWNLIQGKIVKENNFTVSPDEELEAAKEMTISEFMQYGITPQHLPADALDNYAKERLGRERDKNIVRNMVISNKIINLVKEKSNLETKDITLDEFNKLFQ